MKLLVKSVKLFDNYMFLDLGHLAKLWDRFCVNQGMCIRTCQQYMRQLWSLWTIGGKSSESVQCAITGPCLRMRHRPSA